MKSKITTEELQSEEIINKNFVGKELRTVYFTNDGTVIMSKKSNSGCHGCYWYDMKADKHCTRGKELQFRVPCLYMLTHDQNYRIWVEKKGLTKKAKELPTLRNYLESLSKIEYNPQLISLAELAKAYGK